MILTVLDESNVTKQLMLLALRNNVDWFLYYNEWYYNMHQFIKTYWYYSYSTFT